MNRQISTHGKPGHFEGVLERNREPCADEEKRRAKVFTLLVIIVLVLLKFLLLLVRILQRC